MLHVTRTLLQVLVMQCGYHGLGHTVTGLYNPAASSTGADLCAKKDSELPHAHTPWLLCQLMEYGPRPIWSAQSLLSRSGTVNFVHISVTPWLSRGAYQDQQVLDNLQPAAKEAIQNIFPALAVQSDQSQRCGAGRASGYRAHRPSPKIHPPTHTTPPQHLHNTSTTPPQHVRYNDKTKNKGISPTGNRTPASCELSCG
jgi:hypothetical protein